MSKDKATNPAAYSAGYRAGRIDRLLGMRSDYSYYAATLDTSNPYSTSYGWGYRDGLRIQPTC